MVILDTDQMSLLDQARSREGERLRERLLAIRPDERATTIISYEEQTRGWLSYVARARTVKQFVEAYRRLRR